MVPDDKSVKQHAIQSNEPISLTNVKQNQLPRIKWAEGITNQYEKLDAVLGKFIAFRDRVNSDCNLLEQEFIKYIAQLDFELKEVASKKQELKLENIDIRVIRKQFAKVEKSFQTINETLSIHSTLFQSVLPKQKAPKVNKKKRPKKKVKNTDDDESFLDSVIAEDKKEQERLLEESRKLKER